MATRKWKHKSAVQNIKQFAYPGPTIQRTRKASPGFENRHTRKRMLRTHKKRVFFRSPL